MWDRVFDQRGVNKWAPDWGSGGIFGLRRCRDVIYYNLAFEAEAHFAERSGEVIYKYDLIAPGVGVGGDTYNASECVDDTIFFGGWINKPIVYKGRAGRWAEISYKNKRSHVHAYHTRERSVSLLWSEGMGDEHRWTGEVSEIIYDPVENKLLIARADGHDRLGIYELDRSGKAHAVSDVMALEGSRFLDYACFDGQESLAYGVTEIQCYDLLERRLTRRRVEWEAISADGGGVEYPWSGYAISAYTRYMHFVRGGLLIGNPIEPELDFMGFVRLLDFGGMVFSQLTPQRSNAVIAAGGVLAPYSAMTYGMLHVSGGAEVKEFLADINEPRAPSLLLYVSPPAVRIVGAYGARITSLAKSGSRVLIAYNTAPNLASTDVTISDIGVRGIAEADEEGLVSRPPPPVHLKFRGRMVGSRHFGGVPLLGYRSKTLKIVAEKSNRLEVFEYDAGAPPEMISRESYTIREGVNSIDLGGFSSIVSFRLAEEDARLRAHVFLSP